MKKRLLIAALAIGLCLISLLPVKAEKAVDTAAPVYSGEPNALSCILMDAGTVTAELAKAHAEAEFEKYRIVQDRLYLSDFDKFLLLEEETQKYK